MSKKSPRFSSGASQLLRLDTASEDCDLLMCLEVTFLAEIKVT
jgi:hypothetical protein